MPKTILINAQVCNALNTISRRLRTELNDTTFYNRDSHTLELTIKAHVTRSEGIRLDVLEIRRRTKNENTHNKQITDRHPKMSTNNTDPPIQGLWQDSDTPYYNRLRYNDLYMHHTR